MRRILKRFIITDRHGRQLTSTSERLLDDEKGRLSVTQRRTAVACTGCHQPILAFEELRGLCNSCGARGSCVHCETQCQACSRRICGSCRRGFPGKRPLTVCPHCLAQLRARQHYEDRQALLQEAFRRRLLLRREWLRFQALKMRAAHLRSQERLALLREMQKLRTAAAVAGEGVNLDDLPGELFPARIGLLMSGDATTSRSCHIPIGKLEHVYVSGSTGSGKSFASRVLAEESALHNLHVLVLDPRNQAAGLLVAEDRREFLDLFAEFQDTEARARAFPFDYFAPGARIGSALPSDLRDLATGRRIVSFKGMDDEQRCSLFARILEAAFDAHSVQESRSTKLVVIIEEAQTFTKKRVAPSAKEAGARAENSLDRLVREGRKYGICVVIVSQTIRDFAYDSASIRQNTNTKIFLRNSDREVDYASDFIGDGRQIIRLRPGAAFVHHGSWGVIKVKFRPPFSKVWEFSPDETRALVEGSWSAFLEDVPRIGCA